MMYSLQSCTLVGLEPHLVECEVGLAFQIPSITMVGLPSSLTQESRDRIRSAVSNSKLEWPARKVTINLLPAQLPKWGSHFELAMALGVLGAHRELNHVFQVFAFGELSLSGSIRPCHWLAGLASWIKEQSQKAFEQTACVPLLIAHPQDIEQLVQADAALKQLCDLAPAINLEEAWSVLTEAEQRVCSLQIKKNSGVATAKNIFTEPCFIKLMDVKNEKLGVCAALLGAANGMHVFFGGPQGRGKSMLTKAMCEFLKPLSLDEKNQRQSVMGLFQEAMVSHSTERPVGFLQSSITRAALEGSILSSGQVCPGELTRAHNGVLIADEFIEYRRDVIEAFRQPIEEQMVCLQRAKMHARMPAKFQLIVSTNLCPCGYFGMTRRKCRCPRSTVLASQRKLSGPILDRFDLMVFIGSDKALKMSAAAEKLIEDILNEALWKGRLQNCWAKGERNRIEESEAFDFPIDTSERVKRKLWRIANAVKNFVDSDNEYSDQTYFECALLLRCDFDALLRSM